MIDVFAEFRDSPVTRLAAMVKAASRLNSEGWRAVINGEPFAAACRAAGVDPASFGATVAEIAETRATLRESGLTDDQIDAEVAAVQTEEAADA